MNKSFVTVYGIADGLFVCFDTIDEDGSYHFYINKLEEIKE